MNISDCDCVILCGGQGKRLKSVVDDVPKVMAEVGGRPFLDHIIEYLKSQRIQRVILCTGYRADFIESYYRRHDFGLTIHFSTEDEPLGTGGALKNAQDLIINDPFLVLNGDSLVLADLQSFLDFHKEKKSRASLLVSRSKEQEDFGNLKLDEDDQIIDFQEKVKGSEEYWINAGIYCFDQSIFSAMPQANKFSLEKDLFPELAGDQFYGHRINEQFMDIGTPQRYEEIKQKLQKD